MAKTRIVAMGMALGVVSLLSACVATVDEPAGEDVAVQEDAQDPILPNPYLRIRRPNPFDPGRRILSCLVDPRKHYISRDPEVCAGIRFVCPDAVAFFDLCGCGCEIGVSPD